MEKHGKAEHLKKVPIVVWKEWGWVSMMYDQFVAPGLPFCFLVSFCLRIADCVFNHMAVVASCDEWQEAQHNGHKMEELQQRLDRSFGPHFDRHDFQWPWICLEGEKWDDPKYMFEGWGCGEWSELRFSEKVIAQHMQHLRLLLNCGVTGIRLDAAKHMRPEHVARYVDFVQGEGAFVYTEVLSMDKQLHSQYERLGKGVPSTDFLLAASLAQAWRSEGGDAGRLSSQLEASEHLGSHSIQFVRNHDTMFNEGSICGIDWSSAEEASLAWAHLIARNEGSILIHQDDIHVPVVHAALAFRSDMTSLAASAAPYQLKTELVAWPPPSYKTMAMLLTLAECPVGLAFFNTTEQEQQMEIPWQLNNYTLQEVKAPSSHHDHLKALCGCWGCQVVSADILDIYRRVWRCIPKENVRYQSIALVHFPHDSKCCHIFYMRAFFHTTNEKRLDALLPTWISGYLHEWLDSFFWNASLDPWFSQIQSFVTWRPLALPTKKPPGRISFHMPKKPLDYHPCIWLLMSWCGILLKIGTHLPNTVCMPLSEPRLFYYSGWECPHIHFCVEHVWSNLPGWVMRKCEKPAVQGDFWVKQQWHF